MRVTELHLLAQSSGDTTRVLIWIGVLIAVALAGGAIAMLVRSRLLSPDDDADGGTLLEQLQKMRDRGEISDEEFRATRRTMIERAEQRRAQKDDDDAPPPARMPKRAIADDGSLRAPPGVDLTGRPLPRSDPGQDGDE